MNFLLSFATIPFFTTVTLASHDSKVPSDQFYLRDSSNRYVVAYHSGAGSNYAVLVPPDVSQPSQAFFNGSTVQFELSGSPYPWFFEVLGSGVDNTPYNMLELNHDQ